MRSLLTVVLGVSVLVACQDPGGDAADGAGPLDLTAPDTSGGFSVGFDSSNPPVPDTQVPDLPEAPPEDTSAPEDLGVEVEPDAAPAPVDVACVPFCEEAECGDDYCGGSCGVCPEKTVCGGKKCVPDPTLGCEGLDLAEAWEGKFKGDITFSALSLIPFDASTSGDMSFTIKCFNSKLIVNGTMSGEASGNKFTLTMSGTYKPSSKSLEIKLLDGDVTVWGVMKYVFGGEAPGTLGADGTFTGTWNIKSTTAFLLGTENAGLLPLVGEGTWSAAPN